MTTMFFRHGDLVLTTTTIPEQAHRTHKGRLVLAEGEVTGHAHVIDSPDAELWGTAGSDMLFLRVLADAGVDLFHDEHDTLTIPPGDWRVTRQREYAPEAPLYVAD